MKKSQLLSFLLVSSLLLTRTGVGSSLATQEKGERKKISNLSSQVKKAQQNAKSDSVQGWKRIGEEDGIEVFERKVKGSDVVALRGVGHVYSPIERVAAVVIDESRRKEWVPDLEGSRIVKQISEHERIEYLKKGTPFIIKDRDFVFHAKAKLMPERSQVRFDFKSVESSDAPPTGAIRGKLLSSHYLLTRIGAQKTRFELEIHVDPMGSVPRWLVNMYQRKYPVKFLNAIRKQVVKQNVVANKEVKDAFQKVALKDHVKSQKASASQVESN